MSIERYPENDKHILEHWEKVNKRTIDEYLLIYHMEVFNFKIPSSHNVMAQYIS